MSKETIKSLAIAAAANEDATSYDCSKPAMDNSVIPKFDCAGKEAAKLSSTLSMQEQRKFSAMVSIKEAAKMLAVSYSTLHRIIQSGKIQQVQISARRKVIPLDSIEAYIQSCYNKAA